LLEQVVQATTQYASRCTTSKQAAQAAFKKIAKTAASIRILARYRTASEKIAKTPAGVRVLAG
jgi:hypothetical protein